MPWSINKLMPAGECCLSPPPPPPPQLLPGASSQQPRPPLTTEATTSSLLLKATMLLLGVSTSRLRGIQPLSSSSTRTTHRHPRGRTTCLLAHSTHSTDRVEMTVSMATGQCGTYVQFSNMPVTRNAIV